MSATIWALSGTFYLVMTAGMFCTLYGLIAGKGRICLLGVCLGILSVVGIVLGATVGPVAGLVLISAALTVAGVLHRRIHHLVMLSERTGTNR